MDKLYELIDAGGDDEVVLGRYSASGPISGKWLGSHTEALEAAGLTGDPGERRH